MKINVAILGGSGYTALECMQILLRHPYVNIAAVTSRQGDKEETPLISDLHPRLKHRLDLRCQSYDVNLLKKQGVQVAFGCLPHGISMASIPVLLEAGIKVIDLSADYRLRDPAIYSAWYKHEHTDQSNLAQAVYGLPEIYGTQLRGVNLIANPGCYPQTAILGLAPLVAKQLIELSSIIVDSKSGVSGGGRSPSLTFHFPECNESVAAYGVGNHRHTPEIEQVLSDIAGEPVQVVFTPHLIPMDRGILSTIYAAPKGQTSEATLMELYREFYKTAPFIRVVDKLPATKDTVGTNYLDITLRVVRGRIIAIASEDNLIRGASGVAVQNFNLMFGFPETTALV
ncbi:MAG TPA: N-acetyl-gamma-glutamyl-phosphate reductase [Gemmatales bacterium]|nr:N-acetyl-gamma-glutamyl-phosphate reductase [Gemmatales bacterium]